MKPTYREKNLLDYLFAGFRSTLTPVAGLNLLQEKVSRFSELSSQFEFWGSFSSNVKVNPVFSWIGQNSFQRIFPLYSQHFTTPLVTLHHRRESLVALHDTLYESTPQTTEKNTVKRKLKRESSRKSLKNQRLFPGANLVLQPALRDSNEDLPDGKYRILYFPFLRIPRGSLGKSPVST